MEERERILKYQFDSYCKKVIKRTACRLLKINKNRLDHEQSMDSLINFNNDSHSFNYDGEDLLEELLKLDKCSIEILFAYYVYGMKCAEIAKLMRTTPQRISYLKNKAIGRLRINLKGKEI
ncbi:sigma-70 family RNA polymerase sigma factor [Enterococcus cecorum]|uniref:sigma-70 family RNA polymerase sigma factor n=1 Tax=Enterococcus cecorum TaxID=44008 RepID=UPI00200A4AB4|nr:sigma-70 family RNA polymerase sigma factor [Enterococcus cecorum]